MFRAFGNPPRPDPWLPYVFTSPADAIAAVPAIHGTNTPTSLIFNSLAELERSVVAEVSPCDSEVETPRCSKIKTRGRGARAILG